MRRLIAVFFGCILAFTLVFFSYKSAVWIRGHKEKIKKEIVVHLQQKEKTNVIKSKASRKGALQLPGYLLAAGVHAHNHAQELGETSSSVEILVDFSQPSNAKRLWIIDLATGDVLLNTYVTHGANSGGKYAEYFSNRSGSHESSIGAYLIEGAYYGKHGHSLRIEGLESTNSNAESRAVVLHSAWYASSAFIALRGQAGHSWGCFGVPPSTISSIIHIAMTHPHTLLLAYYPDSNWLENSRYV